MLLFLWFYHSEPCEELGGWLHASLCSSCFHLVIAVREVRKFDGLSISLQLVYLTSPYS